MGFSLAEEIADDLQKGQGPKPLFPTKCRVLPYEITDVKVMVDPTDSKAFLILDVVSSKTKHSKRPLKIPISELSEISRNVKRVRGASP
jgi:hypothetical protein